MMNFITYKQLNLFQDLVNCFPFFQRRKRKKPRGKIWFINLLQKLMALQNDANQRVRETKFCNDFEPRLGGGQKYCQNRSESSNKWKCHKGWSFWRFFFVVVLSTNHVGEDLEGPKRCQIAMDCKSFGWKSQPSKWKEGTNFTQLQKWSQKDLIKSWCLLNQNG